MRLVIESKDIDFVRATLRARGFECLYPKGWMRGKQPAAIYFNPENGNWFTVIDE